MNSPPERRSARATSAPVTPIRTWKKALFGIVTVLAILGTVEGGLALFGVRPSRGDEDPFVGYVARQRLYTEVSSSEGVRVLETSPGKRGFFNEQRFVMPKPDNTYRIFCLGGSTTYGHPYTDVTSFAGWLRALLPAADPSRRWEVINAGGISYASYRVARLVEELIEYEPDLLVVYSGHNEFLEERTYRAVNDIPAPIRYTISLLGRTRIWAGLDALLGRVRKGADASSVSEGRGITEIEPSEHSGGFVLPTEVRATLDHSAGPALYERDDALRQAVLRHYEFSLERVVRLAASVGAGTLFVTPASNLKDCSPFKSQHTDGISAADSIRSEELCAEAVANIERGDPATALTQIETALAMDPRAAELLFRRGQALLQFDRTDEAAAAFSAARDEDVCALRALSETREIVAEVARRTRSECVDFVRIAEEVSQERTGKPIPGAEIFLDHVHPTIEGNRIIALALIDAMQKAGTVHPTERWGPETVGEVAARVEGSLDLQAHANGLATVALTLDWAGKKEESRRLAAQAIEAGTNDPTAFLIAGRHHAAEGDTRAALDCFRSAVRASPNNPVVYSQFGLFLVGIGEDDAAAAHFFIASLLLPDNAGYHQQLGYVQERRGQDRPALASYVEARRLDPQSEGIRTRSSAIEARLAASGEVSTRLETRVTRWPSGYPRTVAQVRAVPGGESVLDGIWTEWHETGELAAVVDYANGIVAGSTTRWDRGGNVLEHSGSSHTGAHAGSPH